MCTLILAWQVLDGSPLSIAANRDERLDRPSRTPRVIDDDPIVVAPQDAEADGTWLGVNEQGLAVAITNRRTELDDGRSRGLLVRDALARSDAATAAAFVERAVERDDYAGFNLLLADAADAIYLEWDGELRRRTLDPGVHVIVNAGLDDAADKAARIRDVLTVERGGDQGSEQSTDAETWLDRATNILSDHEYDACVHRDGYGTVFTSLLSVADDGVTSFQYADGPPCRTAFDDASLPTALGRTSAE